MKPTIKPDIAIRNSATNLDGWFDCLDDLTVGESIGECGMQGAYDRWPVHLRGERVGTLYDDATGTTYDASDDDGEIIN